LDTSDVQILLFYVNAREELLPAIVFPPSLKKRAIYYMKKTPGAQLTDKLDQHLIMGDISANPLEFLSLLLDEVYMPLLSNPKNMESWPEVVATDVIRHFQSLSGAVYVISGKAKGKTMLPMPDLTKLQDQSDRGIIHALENTVIEWNHQIQEVLKTASNELLEDGSNPGPQVEIDFWNARASNLENIHAQLHDEKIQKIAKVLQVSNSSYYAVFNLIYNDVKNGKNNEDIDLSVSFG
jgi:dynein heavy chain